MVADFQRKSVLLSPEERRKQEQAVIQKQQTLQQRANAIHQEASSRQEELMKPVLDRVQKAIEDVRMEGGYAIIFDKESGAMVAADSTLDLTTQVIERMKGAANGSGGASNESDPAASSSGVRNPLNPPKNR
jgi:outer membrane protein